MNFKYLKVAAFNIFLLLLFFVFAEIFCRIMGLSYANAPLEGSEILHHEHPKNFHFINHSGSGEFAETVNVFYDGDGLRYNPESTKSRIEEIKVAFFGDSYVESNQVSWDDTFIGNVERYFDGKIDVKNFGVSSYSPVLSYLQWHHYGIKYKPDYVFLFLYSNDPRDDEIYLENGQFEEGELVAVKGPKNEMISLLRRSYFVRFIRKSWLTYKYKEALREQAKKTNGPLTFEKAELNPDVTKTTAQYILKLKAEVEKGGGKFILAVVPSKYRHLHGQKTDSTDFAKKWEAWARESNITNLDLTTPFEAAREKGDSLFFNIDLHFNLKGHNAVAKEVIQYLENDINTVARDSSALRPNF